MKKQEVELIIIIIKRGEEEILNIKIYKDGTLCRSGCGGIPVFGISGMTIKGSKKYWKELLPLIDEKIMEASRGYEDKEITLPVEYTMAFFGGSDNGETGESANWTKTTGIRFLLDIDSSFRHPLLDFVDDFAIKATEITNKWFFDIVITAVHDLEPVNLKNTFVVVPKTEEEKQRALSLYAKHIVANSSRGWDIVKIGNGRKYKTKEGIELTTSVENKSGQVSINFYKAFGKDDVEFLNECVREAFSGESKTPKPTNKPASKSAPTTKNTERKPSKNWWAFWK